MKRIFTILFIAISFLATSQNDPIRVLFIGNSYTAVNNLPQMVTDVAASVGDVLLCESNTPGGCTFQQHCSNTSMTMICKGGWDVVVLQEQSQLPSFPLGQVQTMCFPFAAQLVDSIYAVNPCSRAMFYMTWGRKNGDSENCPNWPPVCTYEGMDSLLFERYMAMSSDNKADVSPVGAVWHYLRDFYPNIELYSGDGSHPSPAGSYAAACAFYTLILKKDPIFITNHLNVPDSTAETIKAVAKAVVYDSLSKWLFVENSEVTADFTYLEQGNNLIAFQNLSAHATGYEWDFGDGNFSNEENPVHQYAEFGEYEVALKAFNDCSSDSFFQMVSITDISFIKETISSIHIFPNPISHDFTVSNAKNCLAEVFDLDGKIVWKSVLLSDAFLIDASTWAPGVYLMLIWENNTLIGKRKVLVSK